VISVYPVKRRLSITGVFGFQSSDIGKLTSVNKIRFYNMIQTHVSFDSWNVKRNWAVEI